MNIPTIIAYDIEFPTSYSRRISFFKNLTPSIFLAGPTNRNGRTQWRTDIIKLFSEREFAGSLFVPEFMDASKNIVLDKKDIIDWELDCCENATYILFWIPRSDELPAFTTNVEFGMYHRRRNVVVGSPPNAPKMVYLQTLWRKHNYRTPWCNSLEELVDLVISEIAKMQNTYSPI